MIDLSACPISLDPSERQKLEELARQLPLIAELSACELFIDCVGDDGGVVVAHAWSNQLGSFYAAPAVGKHVKRSRLFLQPGGQDLSSATSRPSRRRTGRSGRMLFRSMEVGGAALPC